MSLPAVVLVTLFRRPEYTRRTLAALAECYHSAEVPIYLSCDGPAKPEDADAAHEVQEIARRWNDARKAAHPGAMGGVILSQGNMGTDEHLLQTIPVVLELSGADRFLHLEDDILPALDCLNCLTTLLKRSEADPAILSVAAYSWQATKADFDRFAVNPYATVTPIGFCSWGWGMRAEVWNRLFAENGAEYRKAARLAGKVNEDGTSCWYDSWISKQQGRMIRPWVARIQQIGAEGGVHSKGVSHHYKYNFNEWGAWSLPSPPPDTGLLGWGNPNAR